VIAVLAKVLVEILNLFHNSEHFLGDAFGNGGNAAMNGGIAQDN
jgi:hypothetical protein